MIIKPLGFYTYGMEWLSDVSLNDFDGFRICQITPNNGDPGDSYSALSTSRWRINPTYQSGNEPPYQWGTPADGGALDEVHWAVMGTTYALGISNQSGFGSYPAWWCGSDFESNNDLFSTLNALPYNQINGNYWDPTAVTRDEIILDHYQNGFWFWRHGNLPPLSQSCLLSFEFETDSCWESEGSDVQDLSGLGNDGVVVNTPPSYDHWAATATTPYCGVFPFQDTNYITVANTITTTNNCCTYEWVNKVTSGASQQNYVFVTELSAFLRCNPVSNDWDFSGLIQINTPVNTIPNHGVLSIDTQVAPNGSARLYLGNNTGYALAGSSNASAAVYGKVGADLTIGGFGVDGYDGDMNMFRIWDGVLNSTQAEILWYHSQYKTHW
jgi:hypothetical protein